MWQHFHTDALYEARSALMEKGILYLPVKATTGHFAYATLLNAETRGNSALDRKKAESNLAKQISLIKQHDPEYIILSAESFFNVAPESIIEVLKQLGEVFHVVAFVRNPADLYLSLIQQQLKASHRIYVPGDFVRDFEQVFSAWKNTPSCASISVRVLEAAGSVLTDFQDILRHITSQADIHLADVRHNETLSAEQMIVIQAYRRDFFQRVRGYHEDSNRILALFQEMNRIGGLTATPPRLSSAARSSIMQANRQQIEAFESMFPGLTLRKQTDSIPAPNEAVVEYSADDVMRVLEAYRPDVVQALHDLLPKYNLALTNGDVSQARAALAHLKIPTAFVGPYGAFLEAENCNGAAKALHASNVGNEVFRTRELSSSPSLL